MRLNKIIIFKKRNFLFNNKMNIMYIKIWVRIKKLKNEIKVNKNLIWIYKI